VSAAAVQDVPAVDVIAETCLPDKIASVTTSAMSPLMRPQSGHLPVISPIKSGLIIAPEGETLEQKIQRIMSVTSLVTKPVTPVVDAATDDSKEEDDFVNIDGVEDNRAVKTEKPVTNVAVSVLVASEQLHHQDLDGLADEASSTEPPLAPHPHLDQIMNVDEGATGSPLSSGDDKSSKKKLRHLFSVEGLVPKRLTCQSSRHGYLDDFAEEYGAGSPKQRLGVHTWQEDDFENDDEDAETPYGDATSVHQIHNMEDEFSTPVGTDATNAVDSPQQVASSTDRSPTKVTFTGVDPTPTTPKGARLSKGLKIDSGAATTGAADGSPTIPTTPKTPSGLTRSKSASQLKPKTPRPNAAEIDAEIAAMKSELSWSRTKKQDNKDSAAAAGSPSLKSVVVAEGSTDASADKPVPSPERTLKITVDPTTPSTSTGGFTPQHQRLASATKQKMSGSVKMLSAIAKWQGKHNFKNVCRAFFRWTEMVNPAVETTNAASNKNDAWMENDEEDELVADELDNSHTYAGGFGNGRFSKSLSSLCQLYERFHFTDNQLAMAKAFLALKFNEDLPSRDVQIVVPAVVKRIFKVNELVLWPLYVHYTNQEMVVPNIVKGSHSHRKKKLMGCSQLWQFFRDCQVSPDIIGKLQLEGLVNELCDSSSPFTGHQQSWAHNDENNGDDNDADGLTNGRMKVLPNTSVVSPLRPVSTAISPGVGSPSRSGRTPNTPKSAGLPRSGSFSRPPSTSSKGSPGRYDDMPTSATKPFNRLESLRSSILSSSTSNMNASTTLSGKSLEGVSDKSSGHGHQLLSFDVFIKVGNFVHSSVCNHITPCSCA
jgi:hypothetical protein